MRKFALLALFVLLPAPAVRSGDGAVRLLTDEAIPRYLDRGRALARTEQWDKMVNVLQRVIEGDPKIFPDLKPETLNAAVYSEDDKIFYPARELCLKELAELPPAGLRAYRDAYDQYAKKLFVRAEAMPGLDQRVLGYAAVYDKYLVSSFGDDALENAADLNLHLGRYYEALGLYRRLVDVYPKDTDRGLAMVMVKAAYCAARIGDREHRDVLLERVASEHGRARITLEGKAVAAADLKDHDTMRVRGLREAHTSDSDWPMSGGNAARSRVGEDLPEALSRQPLWRFELGQRDRRIEALPPFGRWAAVQHDREKAPRPTGQLNRETLAAYPTARPIVYDGLVLYKDGIELVARYASSGAFVQLRARYEPITAYEDPTTLYPLHFVRPGGSTERDGRTTEDIHRFLDYGGNAVIAASNRYVVVENHRVQEYLRGNQAPLPRRNLLASYEHGTGKTSWGWAEHLRSFVVADNKTLLARWSEDFQRHSMPSFRGPGVALGGMLYTVAFESEGLSGVALWAFDLDDGRVRFRTQIHHPDETSQRLPVGASIAVAGGVVYVSTQSGVVAAVDALPPGRVRWIRRYKRNYQTGAAVRRGRRRPQSVGRIDQQFAYNDPVVSAGKVIVAPADGDALLALDAETGRVAWEVPKSRMRKVSHIVGVSGGVLVLAGSAVCGIDVATGQFAWGPVNIARAYPYGRGFVGQKYCYIPTWRHGEPEGAAIYRYDVRTGTKAPPIALAVEKLGNLVSTGGRLICATEDEVMCFSTVQHELGDIDERLKYDGESAALRLERALVSLGSSPPRRAEARKDFQLALTAARGTPAAQRILARTLDNLFAMAQEQLFTDVLDEARELLRQHAAQSAIEGPYLAQAALIEAQILGKLGRPDQAFAAIEAFLDKYEGVKVVLDGRYVRDATVAARAVRADLIKRSKAFEKAFEKSVRERIAAALEKNDLDALVAIPTRYDNAPPTQDAYFALARLHEARDELAAAEQVLRRLIRETKHVPSLGEAHLRLARVLVMAKLLVEARRERDEGVSRLDEAGRRRLGELITEVDRLLPSPGRPGVLNRLPMPLRGTPLGFDNGAPVQISGPLPAWLKGITVLANDAEYIALDADGKVKWRQPNPTGSGLGFGSLDDPDTTVIATAVAAARFAIADSEHLIIGDVYGLTWIDATGHVKWQPDNAGTAARQADKVLEALRADHAALQQSDNLNRANRLPTYAQGGSVVLSVHPIRGVEAFDLKTSVLTWQDPGVRSAPIGKAQVLGQLVAVGWADPGRVRVYDMGNGKVLHEYIVKGKLGSETPGSLLAPPVLDPLGRLLVVSCEDPKAGPGDLIGRLEILSAQDGRSVHPRRYPAIGRYATVLYADGKLIVFHDGSSGQENLHFIDLSKGGQELVSRRTEDILREVHTIRDGYRLFVFTYTMGLADLGARLFRVDLEGGDALSYTVPPQARSYARPALTRHHIVVAAGTPRSARVRLYDREASKDSRDPKAVFQAPSGGRLLTDFEFTAGESTRFAVPMAIAVVGESLVVSTPFRTLRFVGPETR